MTGTSTVPAMIAIIVVIRIKKIINGFLKSGTTNPKAAKTAEELNIRRGLLFRRLVSRNVLIEPAPGRFYLHEENLEKYYRSRRMTLVAIFFVVGLFILADLVFTHF